MERAYEMKTSDMRLATPPPVAPGTVAIGRNGGQGKRHLRCKRLPRRRSGSQLASIPEAGHTVMVEKADAIADAIATLG